jgi:hypothetical protein
LQTGFAQTITRQESQDIATSVIQTNGSSLLENISVSQIRAQTNTPTVRLIQQNLMNSCRQLAYNVVKAKDLHLFSKIDFCLMN